MKDDLDREADRLAIAWLNEYRVRIKRLTHERQAVYNDIAAQATDPQRIALIRPTVRTEETKDEEGHLLPTRKLHLLCDEEGDFPVARLNSWELSVLDSEFKQDALVGWYRNPARASQDSLGVAYQTAKGEWKSMRPDFIFFTTGAEGAVRASIVDPHGTHLADCLPKLRGLAAFARRFGSEFHRIEAVARIEDDLRVLDLTKESVRTAIEAATDAQVLYAGKHANNYV